MKDINLDGIDSKLFWELPIGIIILDVKGNIFEANDYMMRYFGRRNSIVKGQRFGNLFNCKMAVPNGKDCGTHNECKTCTINRAIIDLINNGNEIREIEIDHEFSIKNRIITKWFTINSSRIIQGAETFILVAFTDISNAKKKERELIRLGITDELTGLYNRRYILMQIKRILNSDKENMFPASLAMIDIDNFKNINDTYGHTFGDEVLKGLAEILNGSLRDTDFAGRYGGEEFLILFTESDAASSKDALERLNRDFGNILRDRMDRPLSFSGGLVEIRKNEAEGKETKVFIDEADKLMYRAKSAGRNRVEADIAG